MEIRIHPGVVNIHVLRRLENEDVGADTWKVYHKISAASINRVFHIAPTISYQKKGAT